MPLFFFTFFTCGAFFLVSNFIKYPQWVFILSPINTLTVLLAQIFSVGIFWFVLGFYFRLRNNISARKRKIYRLFIVAGLTGIILAHLWAGICLVLFFVIFVMIDRQFKLYPIIGFSGVLVAAVILNFNFNPLHMFDSDFIITSTQHLPSFMSLLIKNINLFSLSFLGLVLMYYKRNYSFVKMASLLFVISIGSMLLLNYDWAWRFFYFMPLLITSSIALSLMLEKIGFYSRRIK